MYSSGVLSELLDQLFIVSVLGLCRAEVAGGLSPTQLLLVYTQYFLSAPCTVKVFSLIQSVIPSEKPFGPSRIEEHWGGGGESAIFNKKMFIMLTTYRFHDILYLMLEEVTIIE